MEERVVKTPFLFSFHTINVAPEDSQWTEFPTQ